MGRTEITTGRQLPKDFSGRMFTVFVYRAMYWSVEEIAEVVCMSPHTVKMDLRKIYLALGVEERAAAGQIAWLEGIFQKEDFEGIEWRGFTL